MQKNRRDCKPSNRTPSQCSGATAHKMPHIAASTFGTAVWAAATLSRLLCDLRCTRLLRCGGCCSRSLLLWPSLTPPLLRPSMQPLPSLAATRSVKATSLARSSFSKCARSTLHLSRLRSKPSGAIAARAASTSVFFAASPATIAARATSVRLQPLPRLSRDNSVSFHHHGVAR